MASIRRRNGKYQVQVRIGKYSTSKSLYRGLATAVREHQPQLTMAKKVTLDKVRGLKTSIHPEQQLVSGGFFTPEDIKVLDQFHDAQPHEKFALIDRLGDQRLIHFCQKIIHDNWPEALPVKVLKKLDEDICSRLTTREDVPWLTIDKALEKIEAMLPNCLPLSSSLLIEYRTDLIQLKSCPIQRAS